MKHPQILKNNLIVLTCLLSFYSCFSSQTHKDKINDTMNINDIVDGYINFYSDKSSHFNSKTRYLMLSIINNSGKTQIDVLDNCYTCPGPEILNSMVVVVYKDYKVIIGTNIFNQEEFIFKNFKSITKGTTFQVPPYQDNITYDFARHWTFEYNKENKLIQFCNSVLPELEETKKALHIDDTVVDCDPRK
nr:hypothetical protein [uncultured Chryseobacterium sp.]